MFHVKHFPKTENKGKQKQKRKRKDEKSLGKEKTKKTGCAINLL